MVEGLITLQSPHSPKETADRLAGVVARHGMTLIARIDHAAAAAKIGLELRPTEVLIFGNPKAGTPLMQASQAIGIDLPMKVLVWQDESGATQISYQDLGWLAGRYGIASTTRETTEKMTSLLNTVVEEVRGTTGER